ncbi:MAG: lactose 3-dehydrogenase subunit gamma LacC [Saprospiraceae bacterium]
MNRRDALKNTALLGAAATTSASFLALFQSCQTQDRLRWEPSFLSNKQAHLVTALVDTILPTTDTPGGLDVKVDMFIDMVYAKTVDEAGQKAFVAQMDQFDETCKSKFGKVFYKLDADQKNAVLTEQEANSPKFGRGVWGYGVGEQKPVGFYRSFKSLAIRGYCTSKEIGSEVLNYDPVPGPYQGCIPFEEVGKVYSL